jgi:hypothetical protein
LLKDSIVSNGLLFLHHLPHILLAVAWLAIFVTIRQILHFYITLRTRRHYIDMTLLKKLGILLVRPR